MGEIDLLPGGGFQRVDGGEIVGVGIALEAAEAPILIEGEDESRGGSVGDGEGFERFVETTNDGELFARRGLLSAGDIAEGSGQGSAPVLSI